MAQSAPSSSWPRSKYVAGGGSPRLFYKLQGRFASDMKLNPHRYGGAGIPEGCSLQSYDAQRHADVLGLGLDGEAGQQLRHQGEELYVQVAQAPQCLVLRGQVPDPSTFDYFRDAIGLLLSALDGGGSAVFDPLLQVWWTAQHWRDVALAPEGFLPKNHTLLLVSEDDDPGLRWVHTRGMGKFGRPDISVREVRPDLVPAVEELCGMLIETLAAGTVLPDGQELRTERLPGAWQCCYSGYSNDPDFNNVHFEIRQIG